MSTLFMICIIALIIISDQLLKWAAVAKLKPIESVFLIENLLTLQYAENKGAAFSMFSGQRWFFISITTIVMAVMIYYIFFKKIESKWLNIAMIFIIGGGIANLIDRIFVGHVVDYIFIEFFPAIFNFADICVTVGAVMFIIYILFMYDDKSKIKKLKDNSEPSGDIVE